MLSNNDDKMFYVHGTVEICHAQKSLRHKVITKKRFGDWITQWNHLKRWILADFNGMGNWVCHPEIFKFWCAAYKVFPWLFWENSMSHIRTDFLSSSLNKCLKCDDMQLIWLLESLWKIPFIFVPAYGYIPHQDDYTKFIFIPNLHLDHM